VRSVKDSTRVPGISFVFSFFFVFEVRSKKASEGPVPLPRVNTPDMQDQDVKDARVRYASSEQNESEQRNRFKISASPALTSDGLALTMTLNSDSLGKSRLTRAAKFCFWTGIIFLAVGIACLVISVPELAPTCGLGGSPPLLYWIYGTGIAYTIIGGCFIYVWILFRKDRDVKSVRVQPRSNCAFNESFFFLTLLFSVASLLSTLLIFLSGAFVIAWAIVGAVSLWRDGSDCLDQNFRIWQMGMAAVILSIVLAAIFLLAALFSSKKIRKPDYPHALDF
jgi:hypothetical protein